jgi:hypothetical protein
MTHIFGLDAFMSTDFKYHWDEGLRPAARTALRPSVTPRVWGFGRGVRRSLRFFALPGRLLLGKLNFVERGVMKMMKAAGFDRVQREEIRPLVEFLKG